MDINKFEKLRLLQFPQTEKFTYFDTAYTGLIPVNGKKAMDDYMNYRFENGLWSDEYESNWDFADEVRAVFAKVINADPKEIFFGANSSEILNFFSTGMEFPEGSNIVTSSMSFPATPFNWINRLGLENVRVAQAEDGILPAEKLFELCDEKTAVIALCMVENTSGWKHDLHKIGNYCREHGIYLVIDATQCITAMKIDVEELGIDFLATSCYKWLTSYHGLGIGYCSKKIMDKVNPAFVGWVGEDDKFKPIRFKMNLAKDSRKFELGGFNWADMRAVKVSMENYLSLGIDDVNDYILGLTNYFYQQIKTLPGFSIIGGGCPDENKSNIVFMRFPKGLPITDAKLAADGIRCHIATEDTIRLGLHYYNRIEDIDNFLAYFKALSEA